MTTAKDLVDAIQSGKSATIQATFDSLMTEKIQNGIEAYRQAVIDNTFNPGAMDESEEDLIEDADNQSIDELSKKTLASYTKNAAISAVVGKEKADASTGAMNQRLSSGDVRGAEYHASKANSANRKVGKRIVGIVKAADKLAKD